MCGIVGFFGNGNVQKILLNKLKMLEYRGYDSAGIAVSCGKDISVTKRKGKICNLESAVNYNEEACLGIAHTRWATHGEANEINAHPHISSDGEWAVVHNGIIENYKAVKCEFLSDVVFKSMTDTEVIPQLIAKFSDKKPLNAVIDACNLLKGSFALAMIKKDDKHLYLAKNKSPLYISGNGKGEFLVASDPCCFVGFGEEYYTFYDMEFAVAGEEGVKFYDRFGRELIKNSEALDCDFVNVCLDKDDHFMIKEIKEIPSVMCRIVQRYSLEFLNEKLKNFDIKKFDKIKIIGCGTAYHAALYGATVLQKYLRIEAGAYVASEFRYSNPILNDKTLVIAVSQSGETADTIAALTLSKERGATTATLTNVEYSTIAKLADIVLPVCAGQEIAVASTKAYNAQLAVFYIFANYLIGKDGVSDIKELSEKIDLSDLAAEREIAETVKNLDQMFLIGRSFDYYTALEASLKIKEITYMNANAYQSGELKHGFLALVEENSYIIVFATQTEILDKNLNGAYEAKARGAKLILITTLDIEEEIKKEFYKIIRIPEIKDDLASITAIIPWQIVSYYVSVYRGYNPDKPRNLAKSVTVE